MRASILSEINAQVMDMFADRPLPNIKFFEPRPKFITLLERITRGRLVIDCGAGVGHITKLLNDSGLRACAIDLIPRQRPECEVLPLDSTRFAFNPNTLALIARPCAGEWIQATIERAISRDAEVLYIGVERNLARDIDDLPYTVKALGGNVGKDNEKAFLISQ